jgi:hypothetical protein
MFTSSVTLVSHSDNVKVQVINVHCVSITFCKFLNKISEIMSPVIKSKANAKTTFVNQQITLLHGTNKCPLMGDDCTN